MKKTKEVAAMTMELFQRYVEHQSEIYWRYFMMWYEHGNLAHKDPEKFVKLEKESGSAMWDDPPDDWSERDLRIWSQGYVRGREVECGNAHSIFDQLSRMASKLTNKDYGFRDGLPNIDQAKRHDTQNFVGFWIFQYENRDPENKYIPCWADTYVLQVKDNKIQCWDNEKEWRDLSEEDIKYLKATMPIYSSGIPVSWNSLKKKKK